MNDSRRLSIAPVSPRDCALAVAVPLTREDFMGDLSTPGKDFARHVRRVNYLKGASDEFYWSSVYAPIASAVERSCAAAERAGAHVRKQATLTALGSLFEKHKVVTLVAHWKFAGVTAADILTPRAFLAAVSEPANPQQARVAGAILDEAPALLSRTGSASDDQLREMIADALRTILGGAHAAYRRPPAGAAAGQPRQVDLRRVTRALLEEAFPVEVRAAPVVELNDGMVTIAELVAAIPASFAGVLDMTVCNSVILGAAVKRARPGCLVAVNRYPAELHVRLTFYQLAIQSLARRKAPYIDVLTNQREDFDDD